MTDEDAQFDNEAPMASLENIVRPLLNVQDEEILFANNVLTQLSRRTDNVYTQAEQ